MKAAQKWGRATYKGWPDWPDSEIRPLPGRDRATRSTEPKGALSARALMAPGIACGPAAARKLDRAEIGPASGQPKIGPRVLA